MKHNLMTQKMTLIAAKKSTVEQKEHCKLFGVQEINSEDAEYTQWTGSELVTVNCSPLAFNKLVGQSMPASVELHGRMKTSSKSTQFYVEDVTFVEKLAYLPANTKK